MLGLSAMLSNVLTKISLNFLWGQTMKFLTRCILFIPMIIAMLVVTVITSVRAYPAQVGLSLNANTLTNLLPILYEALDVVSRELVGFIPAVSRDSGVERAALNQTVNIYIAPPITGGNITPGATPPSDGDAVFGNTTMTITKSRYWPVRWNGEEQKQVGHTGQRQNVVRDQFAQGFRAAVNEVEADLYALHVNGSRAFGASGTVPFATASDLSDLAGIARILDDNGAPISDRQYVAGSSAMQNLRGKQSNLFKVNEAGTAELLREGRIGRLEGFDIRATGQATLFTKGTNNGAATTNSAGYAIGATVITLAAAGTGTIIAGDAITFAGDTNIYIVAAGDSNVADAGTITLQEPGLRQAIAAAPAVITTIGNTVRNVAFSRSAIQLATRAPALPEEGDMADDRMVIQDPVSGLAFEVSLYKQYRQVKYEIALAWGVKVVAPRHVALNIGA